MAKECVNYGRRVQNSVFECILDYSFGKSLSKPCGACWSRPRPGRNGLLMIGSDGGINGIK